MRILSAILLSSLIFSVAYAQQDKKAAPVPAKTAVEKKTPPVPEKQSAATPGDQGIQTKKNTLGLTVARAVIAREIDQSKNPVDPGTEFPADVKRVYCISQIQGAKEPVNIEHRWYKNETLINTIELPVKSLNWRTQSYKSITPTMTGNWKVEIVLMPGEEVLTTLNFTVK